MKRRQRKTVLDINGEGDSPRRRWPNERQSHNGSPSNPLANLLGPYNSDSETEDDSKPQPNVLNDQVNDFLKEIQSIAPKDSNKDNENSSMLQSESYWQECYDEQTGYPYYWHTETNQVTWEIPAELKILQDQNQRQTTSTHGSHIPQWSNVSSKKYSQAQSNIPEGMIPKEVVVRNRNRQAGISNKPVKPPVKSDNSKSPGFGKDDSFDEGKIEMITSFGNDESESEDSEEEESQKKRSSFKKPVTKTSQHPNVHAPLSTQNQSNKVLESTDSKSQVSEGPALPPVHYGPQNIERLDEQITKNVNVNKANDLKDNVSDSDQDIIKRLKYQAQLLQFLGKGNCSKSSVIDTSKKNNEVEVRKQDIKLSLVPGYEDDSDGDEESSSNRKQGKPLFPIPEQFVINESKSTEKITRQMELSTGNVKIYDYHVTESEDKIDEANNIGENSNEEKQDDPGLDLESKANKFFESIDAPSKAFQRKKRIAFDVAPNKVKTQDATSMKEESTSNMLSTNSLSDQIECSSMPKEETFYTLDTETKSKGQDEIMNMKKSAIAFVKATEVENTSSPSISSKSKDTSNTEKTELKTLTEPIVEKLKFLSEGSPAASAVQVMAIQIQTLLCAWESGDLQETYLRNWLLGTGCELTRLEQTAAPPGWECQWDRSHKRYYYRNSTTGESQWTYPETDIVGGTEEMDLCTTPPPPEHEDAPIIEMSTQTASMSKDNSSDHENDRLQQKQSQHISSEEPTPPPPPPIISNPSPPPPPRIYAEDLKRGRKRKSSPESTNSDRNNDESSKDEKPRGAEPLPPGVDQPDIAYSLSASALEAGVLYSAQQTNPIYAATLAGAGIPLISHHPHTALMQGQLMHYNPAYHQHLHNQALVAARLSSQEAVQFMVAEYARVYENNQVIAKPPVKMPHESSLGSALNSFYSDIASIEKTTVDIEKEKSELRLMESTPSPSPQVPPPMELDPNLIEAIKEKKRKKLKTGLGKKQKEMSSMVAKWQKAQKNYKEGH